ncbi:DUF2637 domain-containing protein [Curtobacterium sp. MCBD17_040]|uniref:DUF2637 domain-containing protein n=1 Tax=Curtobacterium sp. MCBD17_040 TaxID=2175674 RepID=UPI0024DF6C53|nr:DUF2637 domain-containing protein [Curtobacterium sp. MCBD17_040]WIB65326.1 DUF2637 domain-containing protein [Curtobacterium sp. MCBD17_040]
MSVNGRILSANSPVLLWFVAIAVMIVGLISFALSFTALTSLATMARIPALVAWGWPLIVDGTIVVATFGTLVLRTRDSRTTRVYPWLVLIVFGALSIYANGVHATGGHIGTAEAFVVGAVAPFALLASTHLLVIMLTSPEREATDVELRAATTPHAGPAPSAPDPEAAADPGQAVSLTASAAAPEPSPSRAQQVTATAPPTRVAPARPAPARPVTPPAAADTDAVVARIHEYRKQTGEWPSGGEVGRWLGKSSKTGVRLVNRLREEADGRPADVSTQA